MRIILFVFLKLVYSIRSKIVAKIGVRNFIYQYVRLAGAKALNAQESNSYIAKKIEEGSPFVACRYGANELSTMKTLDFKVWPNYDKIMNQLVTCAGFFPNDLKEGQRFAKMMIDFTGCIDLIALWNQPFDTYYLRRYSSRDIRVTYLYDLEPWSCPQSPWTKVLKGKRVLVIHPFVETFKKQYLNREKIFPGTEILPEFELLTLKAVQTVAGEKDSRFQNWFDALEWMYDEALKYEFDVAIIGCGAYGLPLACKLKKAGKIAIHLAGATQILFGVKGKRWDTEQDKQYVRDFYNDYWVYPSDNEKPSNALKVESGCYW